MYLQMIKHNRGDDLQVLPLRIQHRRRLLK